LGKIEFWAVFLDYAQLFMTVCIEEAILDYFAKLEQDTKIVIDDNCQDIDNPKMSGDR